VREEAESSAIGKEGVYKLDSQKLLELTLTQMYCRRGPDGDASAHHYGEKQKPDDSKDAAKTISKSSPLTFEISGTTLSATAPVELHDKLRRMLDAWSESGMAQIAVETRFLNSNRDLVSELGASWQFIEAFSSERENPLPTVAHDGAPIVHAEASVDEYLPLVVATLNEQQTTRLIDIAQGDRRTNVLNAPKVTIFNGMEAMVADCSQRPFVVGVFSARCRCDRAEGRGARRGHKNQAAGRCGPRSEKGACRG